MVRRQVPLRLVELHGRGLGDPGEGALVAGDGARHALGAQGDAAVDDADHDRLGDPVQGFHAGTALAVGIESGHLGRKPGHLGHPAQVNELGVAQHVAQPHVLDHAVFDLGIPVQQVPDDLGAKLVQAGGDQFAPGCPGERGTDAIDDDCISKFHDLPLVPARIAA